MSKRRIDYQNRPRNVEGQIAVRTEFYRKYLSRLTKGIFTLNCPDYCDRDYVLNNLMFRGYLVITDTPAGVLPLRGSLYGFNYQNVQTKARVIVPTLPELEKTIGVDCEIVYLDRNFDRSFFTFHQVIDIYANKLAMCDSAIDVNLINSKLSYIAEAESKAQAETIKKMYDRISDGEPFVVYKKDALSGNPMNIAFNNLKQNYIAIDLYDTKRSIINEYLTMLGVNNANTDKKERLLTSEVSANNEELKCNTEIFRNNLKTCKEKINKMFPSFEFNIDIQFKGEGDKSDIVRDNTNVGDATQ